MFLQFKSMTRRFTPHIADEHLFVLQESAVVWLVGISVVVRGWGQGRRRHVEGEEGEGTPVCNEKEKNG